MSRKKINLEDASDFITGGDLSDLSDLSEEGDFEEYQVLISRMMMKMTLMTWRMKKTMYLFPQFSIKNNVMKI